MKRLQRFQALFLFFTVKLPSLIRFKNPFSVSRLSSFLYNFTDAFFVKRSTSQIIHSFLLFLLLSYFFTLFTRLYYTEGKKLVRSLFLQ